MKICFSLREAVNWLKRVSRRPHILVRYFVMMAFYLLTLWAESNKMVLYYDFKNYF